MRWMLRLIAFLALVVPASAQYSVLKRQDFTATGSSTVVRLIGSGTSYHKLTWNGVGPIATCSMKVEQASAPAGSWSDLITAQTCTSNGDSTIFTGTPNYIRITLSTFTGTAPTITAVYTGYRNDPTGSGGGSVTMGADCDGCTVGSVLFVGAGPVLAQDNSRLFWDDAIHQLTIFADTGNPGSALAVRVDQASGSPQAISGDGRYNGTADLVNPTQPLAAYYGSATNESAHAVSATAGMWLDSNSNTGGGTIGDNIGLFVGDQTAGTNNYAIKTGVGKVVHADPVFQVGPQSGFDPSFSGTIQSTNLASIASVGTATAAASTFGVVTQGTTDANEIFNQYNYAQSVNTSGTAPQTLGMESDAVHTGAGNVTSLWSYKAFQDVPAAAGTVTEEASFVSEAAAETATTVGSMIGFHALPNNGTAVTNNYGLKIEDQTCPGCTNNFAIKTGAGKVELGDSLVAAVMLPKYSVSKLAQVAAITTTTIATVGSANVMFDLSVAMNCTASSAAATVNLLVSYTDPSNTAETLISTTAIACTTLGTGSVFGTERTFAAKAGTLITYSTSIANTPTYDLRMALDQRSLN